MKRLLRRIYRFLLLISVLLLMRAWFELWTNHEELIHLAKFSIGSRFYTADEFQGSLYFTGSSSARYTLERDYPYSLRWLRMG
jgi:hypothetical protein